MKKFSHTLRLIFFSTIGLLIVMIAVAAIKLDNEPSETVYKYQISTPKPKPTAAPTPNISVAFEQKGQIFSYISPSGDVIGSVRIDSIDFEFDERYSDLDIYFRGQVIEKNAFFLYHINFMTGMDMLLMTELFL